MSSDGYGSDHGTASIPHDAPTPSPPLPRLVQLRSRIIIYTDTNNPNPHQPTPSSFLDNLTRFERHFLGLHAAREALPMCQSGQPPLRDDDDPPEESFMLSERELRGLDAEIYGHLDPEEHGLTFSRRELRQLFDEAEARRRTRTPFPVEPSPAAASSSSSSTFSWEGTRRREERQRIFDAWEEFRIRLLPSPEMFQASLDRVAPEDFEEPVEEARRVKAPRTSRRRNFDEVDPDSEDEAEARGRSRRRIDSEREGEAGYRDPRRIRRPRGRRGGFTVGHSR